jgi:dinuclear metal center YbgI/SA1388 family protein
MQCDKFPKSPLVTFGDQLRLRLNGRLILLPWHLPPRTCYFSRMLVRDIINFLESFAPPALAEDWDNVGLLVGRRGKGVARVMTCLTVTEEVADEAAREKCDLIVSHHPLMFKAIQRITDDTPEGRVLLTLIRHEVDVYSPHTAFDSAGAGINQGLAEKLGLRNIAPIRLVDAGPDGNVRGSGRYGRLDGPLTLSEFCAVVTSLLGCGHAQYVGDPSRQIQTVAVACGAAAEFLHDAAALGCDVLLTGEARFHAALEARASGIALVLAGHYATERPGVEDLAGVLSRQFPTLTVWASRDERDPLSW